MTVANPLLTSRRPTSPGRQIPTSTIDPASPIGKVARQIVINPQGTLLVVSGQKITASTVAAAQRWDMLEVLKKAVDR